MKEYIEEEILEMESMKKSGFITEYGQGRLDTLREILKLLYKNK